MFGAELGGDAVEALAVDEEGGTDAFAGLVGAEVGEGAAFLDVTAEGFGFGDDVLALG